MSDIDENQRAGQQWQQTFEAYFTGLTFTILGLSVQTAKFSCSMPDALELASWALLFAAGLAGLRKAQWMPNLYKLFAEQKRYEGRVEALRLAVDDPPIVAPTELEAIGEHLRDQEETLRIAKQGRENVEEWLKRAHGVRGWCFTLGLILLLLARGYSPLIRLVIIGMPAAAAWNMCP